ncbi:MAG: DUF4124 domain-containing protein [Desulfuromonadales bacterium]|nr:DUF4124 domain-containing protein [Desulfuromonadales bacterium]
MKLLLVSTMLLLTTAWVCEAQTYRWTDSGGVVHFTDSPESVPARYRNKMITEPDITIRDPKIREEIQQQEQRAIQEEADRPRIVPTPDVTPPSPPMGSKPVVSPGSKEPPPRTKSQKIRDNLERRRLEEEKAP